MLRFFPVRWSWSGPKYKDFLLFYLKNSKYGVTKFRNFFKNILTRFLFILERISAILGTSLYEFGLSQKIIFVIILHFSLRNLKYFIF